MNVEAANLLERLAWPEEVCVCVGRWGPVGLGKRGGEVFFGDVWLTSHHDSGACLCRAKTLFGERGFDLPRVRHRSPV